METDSSPIFSEPKGSATPIPLPFELSEGLNTRPQSAPTIIGRTNLTEEASGSEARKEHPDARTRTQTNFDDMEPEAHQPPSRGEGLDPEEDPLIGSTLEELRPLRNPLSLSEDSPGTFERVRLRMKTLQPAHTFVTDPSQPDIQARYETIVRYGMEALGIPKQVPERLLSRSERIIYREELRALDRVLTEVFRYKSPRNIFAYSLNYELLYSLQDKLEHTLADSLEKMSETARAVLPDIPIWGTENRALQYWRAKDFEILGVNFRLQVEEWLALIAEGIKERYRESSKKDKGKKVAIRESEGSRSNTRSPTTEQNPVSKKPVTTTRSRPFQTPDPILESESFKKGMIETVNPGRSVKESTPLIRPYRRTSESRSPERMERSNRPSSNPFRGRREDWERTESRSTRTRLSHDSGSEEEDKPRPGPIYVTEDRESSVSRYYPSNSRTFPATDPRPSALRPTHVGQLPKSYLPAPLARDFRTPMLGTIRDATTSARLQQLLEPSRPEEGMSSRFLQYGSGNPAGTLHPNQGYEPPINPWSRHHEEAPPPRRPNPYLPGGRSAPAPGGGGDEPSDSDDGGRGPPRRDPRIPRRSDRRTRRVAEELSDSSRTSIRPSNEPRFDSKFRIDIIPTWNGNPDDLGRWIMKINRLARQSVTIYRQLGGLVPTRFEGTAERWYYSLSSDTRAHLEENWDSLRQGICDYFMNQTWMENQKVRANNAKYREPGHSRESPSDYFIRKLELLQLNFNYTDRELISQIMMGFPAQWTSILTPHLYYHVEQFQATVKFFEETLLKMDSPRQHEPSSNYQRFGSRNPFNPYRNPRANVNLVEGGTRESSTTLRKPQFPKDDGNVSKRGTPDSVGKRPCRHCGSGKHWDYECRYSRRGEKVARANLVERSPEEVEEQLDYDEAYYALESEEEDFPLTLLEHEA